MSCSNKKCNKKLISSFSCNKCSEEFCTNKCLTEHIINEHKNHHRIPVKMPSKRSIFNFEGKLFKEFIDDPLYNFKNFEFVRTNTNKIQTIGSGAFGNVFLSRNTKDDKLYSIKHIRKSKMISSGESLDIVYREISIHRLLQHDNIIRLYSHSEDDDNIFMIMDYADSGTLFNLIRKKGGLDESEAFKYFIQSASAVAFLHENGFAHRDLKPENLLLTQGNQIKLCDFGWCVDASSGERATFCGTYEYMAPEIVKEVPYDKSIDAWSLGILLYELLHGYSPFRAEKEKGDDNYQEIFKNIIKHKYAIEKNIGKACEDLISKLLTPDHNERIRVKEIFKHPWVVEFESNKEIIKWLNDKKSLNKICYCNESNKDKDDDNLVKIESNEKCNGGNKNTITTQANTNNEEENISNNMSTRKIQTKKKNSNKDIFDFIEKEKKNNESNHTNEKNKIVKQITLNKPKKQYPKDNQKHSNAQLPVHHSQSLNCPDTDFCLFEDKVFEDTLKLVDQKQKRKMRNENESDEIRISKGKTKQNVKDSNKNDFFLFNQSNINSTTNANANDDKLNQISRSDNISSSREKTSADSKTKSVKSKEDVKISQFNRISNSNSNNDSNNQPQEKNKDSKIIKAEQYITKEGLQHDTFQMPNNSDNLLHALDILEKAQSLQDKSSIQPKVQVVENFWDKFFAPFKCGNNNP